MLCHHFHFSCLYVHLHCMVVVVKSWHYHWCPDYISQLLGFQYQMCAKIRNDNEIVKHWWTWWILPQLVYCGHGAAKRNLYSMVTKLQLLIRWGVLDGEQLISDKYCLWGTASWLFSSTQCTPHKLPQQLTRCGSSKHTGHLLWPGGRLHELT